MPSAVGLLTAMANAGVSDEVLGRTVRELLGQAEQWATPVVAAEAPVERLPPRRRALATVKFKLGSGETSVSVSKSLLHTLAQRTGSIKEARNEIRDLARRAPVSAVNRSGWVQDRLAKRLSVAPEPDEAQPVAAPAVVAPAVPSVPAVPVSAEKARPAPEPVHRAPEPPVAPVAVVELPPLVPSPAIASEGVLGNLELF